MTLRRFAAILTACALASCAAPAARSPVDARFLEIAREYVTYGRVDDQNRWSPTLCRLSPSQARVSASDDETTHGRKIYYLFARDRSAYIEGIKSPQPEGQIIVKEAWQPVPGVEGEFPRAHKADRGGNYETHATLDGKTYTTGEKSGLFIMLKDQSGWRYGTVSADGGRVLQSGQIRSCIGCHRDAKPDSLFGLPDRPQDR